MMKRKTFDIIYVFVIMVAMSTVIMTSTTMQAQTADTLRHEVLLETDMGNIRIALYNETPLHRDNFIKLREFGIIILCNKPAFINDVNIE